MTAISALFIGVPRSFMLRRLSAHSPRDSGARRMCCSSWQMPHLFSVSVEPGPEIKRSCAFTVERRKKLPYRILLSLNHDPDAVPAVPEVAERIPRRHRGLRVAAVVPGARQERDVPGPLGLVFVSEAAPRIFVARGFERRGAPAPALVGGDL